MIDVLAWEKRVLNKNKFDEENIFEIYVFKNPEIITPSNKDECYKINTVNFDYKEWKIVNETLTEKPKVMLLGKGFTKDCFCYLNGRPLDFNEISRNIGIEKKHLETILSDYKLI